MEERLDPEKNSRDGEQGIDLGSTDGKLGDFSITVSNEKHDGGFTLKFRKELSIGI
jgi:hypothetical protein